MILTPVAAAVDAGHLPAGAVVVGSATVLAVAVDAVAAVTESALARAETSPCADQAYRAWCVVAAAGTMSDAERESNRR